MKNISRYVDLLTNNNLIHDYIDRILKDERASLNDSMVANFLEIFYAKVSGNVQKSKIRVE